MAPGDKCCHWAQGRGTPERPRRDQKGGHCFGGGGKGRPREKPGGERAGQAEAPPMPRALGVGGAGLTLWLRVQASQATLGHQGA